MTLIFFAKKRKNVNFAMNKPTNPGSIEIPSKQSKDCLNHEADFQ